MHVEEGEAGNEAKSVLHCVILVLFGYVAHNDTFVTIKIGVRHPGMLMIEESTSQPWTQIQTLTL